MNKGIIVAALVVLAGGGVYAFSSAQKDSMKQEQMAMEEAKMMEEKKAMEAEAMKKDDMMPKEGDDMMKKDEMNKEDMMKDEVTMSAGSYEAYAPEKVAMAETKDVVLFFHASWCPSCRGLNSDIEANVAAIPEGVLILKLDYDKETELKKKYGVTTQHTLVQVDKDGNLIKKWSGSPKLASLVTEIQ